MLITPLLTTSLTISFCLTHFSDYIYVPAEGMCELTEGTEKRVLFVLLNPPLDGIFEFEFNVTISTIDDTAIGKEYSRC